VSRGERVLVRWPFRSTVISGERNKFRSAAQLIIILAVYTVRLLTPSHHLTPILSPFYPLAPRDTADYRMVRRGCRIIPRSTEIFLSPMKMQPSHAWENVRLNFKRTFARYNEIIYLHTKSLRRALKMTWDCWRSLRRCSIINHVYNLNKIKLVNWSKLMKQNYGYRIRVRKRLELRFSSQIYFLKINSFSSLRSFTRKCTALQSINLDPTRDHRRDRAVAPRVMARVGNSNVEQSCPRETAILFSPCHFDTIFTRSWSKSDFTK